jgi:N-methylhydantoinase B
VIREFEALEDHLYVQGIMENHLSPPRGVAGGLAGLPSIIRLRCDQANEVTYTDRFPFGGPLSRGERGRSEAGGGGGWGPPCERDPNLVLEDVRNEWMTADAATAIYGVVVRKLGQDFELDVQATEELRRAKLHGHGSASR